MNLGTFSEREALDEQVCSENEVEMASPCKSSKQPNYSSATGEVAVVVEETTPVAGKVSIANETSPKVTLNLIETPSKVALNADETRPKVTSNANETRPKVASNANETSPKVALTPNETSPKMTAIPNETSPKVASNTNETSPKVTSNPIETKKSKSGIKSKTGNYHGKPYA